MTAADIQRIVADHRLWRNGTGGSRANLSGANLSRADLSGAYLSRADLSGAYLSRADLSGADLSGAYLGRANLGGADLSRADLSGADLSGAYLGRANLGGADLSRADLSGAYLSRAYLSGAYLGRANLSRADLSGADLSGAINAAMAWATTEILPREGEVIGWKKCREGRLVKLRVPPDAKRSNATGRKCRAERAEVLEVVGGDTAQSHYDGRLVYRAGDTVAGHEWEPNRFVECGGGIHFFLTREEAEAYTF